MIEYLSPTSLTRWKRSREEFFCTYMVEERPPRDPQTQPMSDGSAFDAYIKAHLASEFGLKGSTFEELFEAQVEEHNRDYARQAGKTCFDEYIRSGAYTSLVNVLMSSDEVELEATDRRTFDDGLTLLGKPDLRFKFKGRNVIHDWKVNGYGSAWGGSPVAGYVSFKGKCHTRACLFIENDLTIDGARILLEKEDWAVQLATYGWLAGMSPGELFYVSVDQLVVKGGKIDVAKHCTSMPPEYQRQCYTQYRECWDTVASGWIFRDVSEAESRARQQQLADKHLAYKLMSDDMRKMYGLPSAKTVD